MTETIATQDDPQNQEVFPDVTPGEQLKQGRERKNLTTEQVSDLLNLKHSFVQQIEADNYDLLPGATFIRGYLRAYGKLVEIDPESLIASYNALRNEDARPESRYKPVETIRPQRSFSDPLIRYTTLIVVAALIGLSVMWWQSRNSENHLSISLNDTVTVETSEGKTVIAPMDISGADKDTVLIANTDNETQPPADNEGSEPEEMPAEDAAAVVEGASPTSEENQAVSDMQQETGADTESLPVDDTQVVSLPQPSESAAANVVDTEASELVADSVSPVPEIPGQETFIIEYSEECWVKVVDSRGITIVNNLKKPGEVSLAEGLPPFHLRIGNASGARVVYQGEEVDLAPHTNRNNIATFTLGE